MEDIILNENIEGNLNEGLLDSAAHSSKNLDLEPSVNKENDIDNEVDDSFYELDDDEDEDENFEDAIDEIIAQNVIDCINETAPSTSSRIFESNESRQDVVQKILERQRK